jgi:ankyrin repeat protein
MYNTGWWIKLHEFNATPLTFIVFNKIKTYISSWEELFLDTYHDIFNFSKKIGYKIHLGICHGISLRWIEACMLNQEDIFIKRIERLLNPRIDWDARIEAYKTNNLSSIGEGDKSELIDVLAFFDSLDLFQAPYIHQDLFGKHLTQNNIAPISTIASSDDIQDHGGLVEVLSCAHVLNQQELTKYLKDLQDIFEKVDGNSQPHNTYGIALSNHNHTIALAYTPEKRGWGFMDINQYPPKTCPFDKSHKLASLIYSTLSSNDPLAFSARVLTTNNHHKLQSLQDELSHFETNKRQITLGHIKSKNIPKNTAYIATGIGNLEVVQALKSAGDGIENDSYFGETPIYLAAQNGHLGIVNVLKDAVDDISKPMNDGATPIFIAAQRGHIEIIDALISVGANLNKATNIGATPIYIAAQNGHSDIVKRLISAGADLSMAMNDGATPFFIAAQNGHLEIVSLLKNARADMNVPMNCGVTPFFIAAQMGHLEIVKLLKVARADFNLAYNATPDTFRAFAKSQGGLVVKRMGVFLLEKKEPLTGELPPTIPMTPKDIATIMGHKKIVDLLNNAESNNTVTSVRGGVGSTLKLTGLFKALSAEKSAGKDARPDSTPEIKSMLEIQSINLAQPQAPT